MFGFRQRQQGMQQSAGFREIVLLAESTAAAIIALVPMMAKDALYLILEEEILTYLFCL